MKRQILVNHLGILGYGHKAFTEVFCKHMGSHYIAPHICHLESLFDKFNKLNHVLNNVYDVRKQLPRGVIIK